MIIGGIIARMSEQNESSEVPSESYPTYPELNTFSDALSLIVQSMIDREVLENDEEAFVEVGTENMTPALSRLMTAVTQPILHLDGQGNKDAEDVTPFVVSCQLAIMHGPITKGRLTRIERAICLIDQIISDKQRTENDTNVILHVIDQLAPFYDKYIGIMSDDAHAAYDHLIQVTPSYTQPPRQTDSPEIVEIEQVAITSSDQGNYFDGDDDSTTITARPGKLFLEQFYQHSVLPNWTHIKFGHLNWLRHDVVDERTSSHSFEAEDGEIYSLIVSDDLPTTSPFKVHGERFKLIPLSGSKRIYCNRQANSSSYLDAVTGYFRLYKFVG